MRSIEKAEDFLFCLLSPIVAVVCLIAYVVIVITSKLHSRAPESAQTQ